MIFQDPYQTLNPRRRVREIVAEPLVVTGVEKAGHEARVARALDEVGLAPARFADRYPHQLSGGQRQRVAIASTLVLEPAGIVCDEPVSMLDVSVRSQILHVLLELQRARELALLFITHDLSLAWQLCDRIAVMYLGRIVEQGDARDVIERPGHPYTQALVEAVPPRKQRTRAGRRAARPRRAPGRLPLPPALPEALRALRPGRPGALPGRRADPRGRLPAAPRACFSRKPVGYSLNRTGLPLRDLLSISTLAHRLGGVRPVPHPLWSAPA